MNATQAIAATVPPQVELALAAPDPAAALAGLSADAGIVRLYAGSEFCERLLPAAAEIAELASRAEIVGVALTLATPIASDASLGRIRQLLPLLPEDAEVVCNDWGVAARIRRLRPELTLVAGRQLCKMIKDPRLPSSQWLRLSPHGIASAAFVALLDRLRVARVEMDVPPFADAGVFAGMPRPVHVHAGVGYAAKGRICRIGALSAPGPRKFAAGAPCRRECLSVIATTRRDNATTGELETFEAGNTLFYRHSPAMREALDAAVAQGLVRRVVVTAT